MRAARLHDFRQPLRLEDVPVPELTAPDDVIVRVGGAGLCRTDIHLVDGAMQGAIPDERPVTLGHENAGWIEATGSPDADLPPGTPVLLHPIRTCGRCAACRRGADMFCGAASFTGLWADGGFAEYVKTSTRAVLPLPKECDPAEVAPHADAGLTVMRAVGKAARLLGPDRVVAVLGAGGGLGHIAVQLLATLTPADVLAVDADAGALALAGELGAHHTATAADAREVAADVTAGRGVDVVLDLVGEHGAPALAVSLLGQGGTYLVVGYGEPLQIPTAEVVVKEIRIEGTLVGTFDELRTLVGMVARGQVQLRTKRYGLEHINEALDDLRAGRVRGRAVIVPDGQEGEQR